MQYLIPLFEQIARAGGGGSGGGSSGGGGSLGGIIAYFLFFYPAWKWSDALRKHQEPLVAGILSIIASSAYGLLWICATTINNIDFAFSAIILSLIAFGTITGLLGVRGLLKSKIKAGRIKLATAFEKDRTWNKSVLVDRVADVFFQFQFDWSNFNLENMKTYLHPAYFDHMSLIMTALSQRGRQNIVKKPQIRSIDFINVVDVDESRRDQFVALVVAKADDRLIEAETGTLLYRDTAEFAEKWHFVRRDSTWLLVDIEQITQDKDSVKNEIRLFARDNGFYYSADWGSLLLPKRGQLFRKGSFSRSDINNHVIGLYQGILFELYTYRPNQNLFLPQDPQILVAQVALPKQYGKVVVQQRQPFWHISKQFPTPRLRKISLEGVSFDKSYQVFAENKEQVTSLELLDPRLMEMLLGLPVKINIEVVDNVLYLYTSPEVSYQELFVILKWAFKNMKM